MLAVFQPPWREVYFCLSFSAAVIKFFGTEIVLQNQGIVQNQLQSHTMMISRNGTSALSYGLHFQLKQRMQANSWYGNSTQFSIVQKLLGRFVHTGFSWLSFMSKYRAVPSPTIKDWLDNYNAIVIVKIAQSPQTAEDSAEKHEARDGGITWSSRLLGLSPPVGYQTQLCCELSHEMLNVREILSNELLVSALAIICHFSVRKPGASSRNHLTFKCHKLILTTPPIVTSAMHIL